MASGCRVNSEGGREGGGKGGKEGGGDSVRCRKLKQLLEDLEWHAEILRLEILAVITQGDFNPDDSELRCLLRRLKGGTSRTKDVLESTFAHLADIAQRRSKNKYMVCFMLAGCTQGPARAAHNSCQMPKIGCATAVRVQVGIVRQQKMPLRPMILNTVEGAFCSPSRRDKQTESLIMSTPGGSFWDLGFRLGGLIMPFYDVLVCRCFTFRGVRCRASLVCRGSRLEHVLEQSFLIF